jgi:hypothetical protein
VRYGEDHVKIAGVEEFAFPCRQPALARLCLTLGTVAIATRVVRRVLVAAGHALIEVPAERGGAALRDVDQDTALASAEPHDRFEPRSMSTNDARKVEASVGCPPGSQLSAP